MCFTSQVSVANPVSGVSVKVLKCYGTPTTDATKDQFVFLENGYVKPLHFILHVSEFSVI